MRYVQILIAFLALVTTSMAMASISSLTVLNANFETLELREDDKTVTGPPTAAGTVHRYNSVITVDGITVDALVTIESLGPCTITVWRQSTAPAFAAFLSPEIGCPTSGAVTFRMDFVNQATDEPVALSNMLVSGFDVDGSTSNREYHEHRGFASFELDQNTLITVSNQPDGFTRFLGPTSSVFPDVFEDDGAYVVSYDTPVSSLVFRMGSVRPFGTTANRFHYMAFGRVDEFTTPVVTEAPSVVLSASVAETTVGVPFTVTATFSEGV